MIETSVASLILGIIGFFVSGFIYYKKSTNQKLVCLIGEDCDAVVKSKYSQLLGISNEIFGMVYYVLVIVFAILLSLQIQDILGISLFLILFFISMGAAVYSFGLIFIQAFIIKEWCEYCLVSAGTSILIFILYLIPFISIYNF